MDNQQPPNELEAEFLGPPYVSNAGLPQANEQTYGPVPPIALSQVPLPAQPLQAPLPPYPAPTQSQEDPYGLPVLEDTAWNEFLQDAGQWQPGDPFHPAAPEMTIDETFTFCDNYFGEQQEDVTLPDRNMPQAGRPAFSAPQQMGPGAGSDVVDPSELSIDHMTDLSKQVCFQVIDRLNANGPIFDKNGLTAVEPQLILDLGGSDAEKAVIAEEFRALVQPHIQSEPDQRYQPVDQLYQPYQPEQPEQPHQSYQPYQPEQIDLTTPPPPAQFDQANNEADTNVPWSAIYQRQQSPARLPDGAASPVQFHNKYNRVNLRVKCFPCFIGKRKCDREDQPDSICSECAKRAALFPDVFDASVICVKDETNAFKDFKAARVGNHGKAKALGDDDWGARKQAQQEKKAAEKNGVGGSSRG